MERRIHQPRQNQPDHVRAPDDVALERVRMGSQLEGPWGALKSSRFGQYQW